MLRREFIFAISAVGWLFQMTHCAFPGSEVRSLAFFGFELINTSIAPTTAAEDHRIRMLDDLFRRELAASGRFKILDIQDDLKRLIASGPGIVNCNGCQIDYAEQVGADWAAWGTVQKVSNLILNINLYVEDERARKLQFAKSVDIRGNSDEAWRRGLEYLLRNYLFEAL